KDHGEGGLFVGKQLENGEKVIIIEDVMTSGKALRELLPKLKAAANVEIAGMVISVDRMERGLESELSAVQEVYKEFGVKVYSIVTMADIISAIEEGIIGGKEYLESMKNYRKTYGVG
ncbi:MAG: orotate phosphoribosyltransferase, partial [Clostridia bacterium]|nr:orotate phosphoribosyltransferase [Clostridia bacterium]